MINKYLKTIHNKYSTFFKFIFFLRYLFAIFFISSTLLLIIPKFFDYDKKAHIFKDYLLKNYDLKINKFSEINFYILPVPKIEIKNVNSKFNQISSNIYSNKITLYPKLLNIYNYQNFEIKKLILSQSDAKLEINNLQFFLKKILRQNKKFNLENFNLVLINENNLLFNIKDLNYSNFGFNKNTFLGKVFNKKFQSKFNQDLRAIDIKIPGIGLKSDINLNNFKEESIQGNAKLKLLQTNLKFDFTYFNRRFEIFNSFFRSNNLSLSNKSIITLNPFFESDSNFIIEDINIKLFKKIDLESILNSKELIKKINSRNIISFKSKKIANTFVEDLNLEINLAYGRLNYQKVFLISGGTFECKGSINFLEELPLLDFNCFITINEKKKFLKVFSVNHQNGEAFKLNIIGNMSLTNNHIYFKSISSKSYYASKEDLKYFKKQFENILFDENFFKIFNKKKIKKFILEIS